MANIPTMSGCDLDRMKDRTEEMIDGGRSGRDGANYASL